MQVTSSVVMEEDEATTIEQFLNFKSILVSDSETLAVSVYDNIIMNKAVVEGEVEDLQKSSIITAVVEGGLELKSAASTIDDEEEYEDVDETKDTIRKEKPTFWGEMLK